jgi:hypothetical protein
MKRILWRRSLCCVAGVAAIGVTALLLARAIADGKPPPKPPNPQPAVNLVQVPGQNVADILKVRDFGKSVIEFPTEKLLAARTVPTVAPSADAFVNPKVQPGKVHWHKDFITACRAAEKSGKPVLLFQMMGKLDDQFC